MLRYNIISKETFDLSFISIAIIVMLLLVYQTELKLFLKTIEIYKINLFTFFFFF